MCATNPKVVFQQNKEQKIIIVGDSHARGSAGNVQHNLNGKYRSSSFERPRGNRNTNLLNDGGH